jgi:phage replication O-like protein O
MASPQTENGYTRIANEILEQLVKQRFQAYETCVLLHIIRMTYGYKKKEDWISLSQFEKATGIAGKHISRTLKLLLSKNILFRRIKNNVPYYGLNKDYETWSILPNRGVPNEGVPELGSGGLPNEGYTKEIIQKKYITSPSVSVKLSNNKKTMQKNKLGKYREDTSSDSYETVIDVETGESPVEEQSRLGEVMNELLAWGENRKGSKFVNVGKQRNAMKKMRLANIPLEAVKQRWVELEGQEFYKKVGMDFMSVCSSFDKKPLK